MTTERTHSPPNKPGEGQLQITMHRVTPAPARQPGTDCLSMSPDGKDLSPTTCHDS